LGNYDIDKHLIRGYNNTMVRRSIKKRRDKELIRYRLSHPDLSLAEIGETFGITKQRVSQILKRDSNI